MKIRNNTTSESAQIRSLVETWTKAISRKDIEDVMACYAADVLMFDLAPPLQKNGLEEVRKELELWFPTWDGPIDLQTHDLRIAVTDNIAYCSALQHIRGTKLNGEKPDVWFRLTICFKKTHGRWRVVHEHTSTPFYMDGSERAALDLKP